MKFLTAIALALATPAAADDLKTILADHWAWYLSENPVMATALGERRYDSELGDLTLAAMDRSAAKAAAFRARLAALPKASLTPADAVTADILTRLLTQQIDSNAFPARAMLFTNREGFHTGIAGMALNLPFDTAADYNSYLARLALVSTLFTQATETTRAAIQAGYVLPCTVLAGFDQSIRAVAVTPEKSRLYSPFAKRPATIAEGDWTAMQARARTLISGGVNPAYTRFADFIAREYLPRCTKTVGVSALPDGARYYALRIAQETTTAMTADEIHKLGLSEVARIRAEMEAVARKAGFPTREAFIADLRTNPIHYAKTPEELMAAASRQAKIADGWMPRLFGKLPRLPYGLREIPAETAAGTTTAYYVPGSPPSGIAGTYYVNTSKLNERPLYELPALTIHEAVPGHHHQIALTQELDLPPFRQHAAFFTAFVEGWGLYSERLGIEMGMYDTPAKDMGRLSYEMWRACRLVVDTGLHAKGWSKEQAVKFMTDNTALSAANIDAEVNRYISWPAQALAYKVGELKIRELRTEAETTLGPRFNLRAFHDALLENGSIPLDVLEAHMKAWIASQKAAPVG
ncbi:DUF885 domain-containing protein [Sandaracinobacteroides saxicola]|uniref:DUF885 domain-containing protein n=1 Tax=Sandaracinobacteroides saxicola TaxID=2759707 RepID=A0A7G5IL13_9SPHN|nr:DUF885 domain-containing protein [Sandaracinobacteroides saxicola]QMW24055.1 DUF885 domain-containing protein [Sandaracinobacteroides saxicola]